MRCAFARQRPLPSVYVFVDMHGTAAGTPAGGNPISASDPSHYIGVTVGNQGRTPGYWKNHTDSWPATGYSPTQTVSSVFARGGAGRGQQLGCPLN